MARLTKEKDLWSSFIEKTRDKKKTEQKVAEEAVADELKISKQNPGKEEGGRSPYEPWKPAPSGPYSPAPKDKWQVNADGIPRNIDQNPNASNNLARQLQINDETLLAGWPFGGKSKDTTKVQGHYTHQRLLMYAGSDGSMSTLPEGWTHEEAIKYRQDFSKGLLKPR